jgi:NitT/TauT family transport system substrate-binding protein/sulfonate transport system substrate-binding protein
METVQLALLRGICQLPAYVAADHGFLEDEGIDGRLSIACTAWTVPEQMARGEVEFAVIPWTRVAADRNTDNRLVLIAGSGVEEAALVVRPGLDERQVRRVAVPQEGGIKDLTALALIDRMGWSGVEVVRMPSGDAAILTLIGGGADAASMVEPYATMLVDLGLGRVVRRTGDVWPGAPGCSLTTTARVIAERPELVLRMVRAYSKAARFVADRPDEAARTGARFIGVDEHFVRKALEVNRPDPSAIRRDDAMLGILDLMTVCGYIEVVPAGYRDLSFLDQVEPGLDSKARRG